MIKSHGNEGLTQISLGIDIEQTNNSLKQIMTDKAYSRHFHKAFSQEIIISAQK